MRSWLLRVARENSNTDPKSFLDLILPRHLQQTAEKLSLDGLTVYTPSWVADVLAERTGVSSATLQRLTLAYWVPVVRRPTIKAFANYIEGFDVIERPLPSMRHPYFAPFKGVNPKAPWLPTDTWDQGRPCRYCQETNEYEQITWLFGLTATCPWHERDLYYDWGKARSRTTADWLTGMAFRHGAIPLPHGGVAPAKWWLRMLRALIQQVSSPEWYLLKDGSYAEPFRTIWASRQGVPPTQMDRRHIPQAFEDMGTLSRSRYLRAASVALDMVIAGAIKPPENSEARVFSPPYTNTKSFNPLRDFGYRPIDLQNW